MQDLNKANSALAEITSKLDNFDLIKFFLLNSTSNTAISFAALSLKNMFTDNWKKINTENRVHLREEILSYLAEKGPSLPKDALNPVIILMTRVVKLSWFDHQSHQDLVH